jgi:methionyl-tRNA formyltransferase
VSVIEISKNEFDAGAILSQKRIEMDKNSKFDEL